MGQCAPGEAVRPCSDMVHTPGSVWQSAPHAILAPSQGPAPHERFMKTFAPLLLSLLACAALYLPPSVGPAVATALVGLAGLLWKKLSSGADEYLPTLPELMNVLSGLASVPQDTQDLEKQAQDMLRRYLTHPGEKLEDQSDKASPESASLSGKDV